MKMLKIYVLFWLAFLTLGVVTASGQVAPNNGDSCEPISQFKVKILEKIQKNSIDLDAPFRIEFESSIAPKTKSGPLITKLISSDGGSEIEEVVEGLIKAMGDCEYFSYLNELDITYVRIFIGQDAQTVSVKLTFDVDTEERAVKAAKSLKLRFSTTESNRNDTKRLNLEILEELIRSKTKVVSFGKTVVIGVEHPKAPISSIIMRELINISRSNNLK